MKRNGWILLWCAVAALALVVPLRSQKKTDSSTSQNVDILISGGTVVDGTGSAPRKADVGIRGDRIVFVGDAKKSKVTAARTIDAKGLIVTPGFIDPHTHVPGELADPKRNTILNYLMQGVTTVITGNDGAGPIEVAATLKKYEDQGIGVNAGLLVGHGTVRRNVVGRGDAQPTAEQLEKMKSLVKKAMEEGALGMSTGLFYVPGSFAKTEEVIELSRVAGAMGGIYDSHMRDENSYSIGLLGSIEETIRIGREANIPVNISHIKALGPDVWGKSVQAIELIRKARAEGVKVSADQYPYVASGSGLTASLLPPDVQAEPRDSFLSRVADPTKRAKLLADMEVNLKRRGGAHSMLFTSPAIKEIFGKRLDEVAKAKNLGGVEAALEIITDAYKNNGGNGLAIASFNMNEDDVARFMKEEFVTTGSDGSAGHPRLYGTFPKKLREYVYTKKTITLPFFVQHSSAMTAENFHIKDRGLLKDGWFADIAVFDPATVTDKSTYEKPEELATGMKFVLVNGKLAVENGEPTKALAGRPIRPGR
ncbi:MAG: D-aminoacylase [Acidobacteria bacterium]|nr:D-aminoacylase [Acidobacteriota bacterium]